MSDDTKNKIPIEIVPALLPDDYTNLEMEVRHVYKHANMIQIDVVDGKFAPTTTWPYNGKHPDQWTTLKAQKQGLPFWERLDFEIDLMVEDQIAAAEDWISVGVARVIGHIEAFKDGDKEKFIALKEKYGVELVMALNPSTPNSTLDEFLPHLDAVQFMGNDKIGYHGVELDEKVLEKVTDLRAKMPSLPIGIDIGVKFETAAELARAGVTRFSAGSLILNSDDVEGTIAELHEIIKEALV